MKKQSNYIIFAAFLVAGFLAAREYDSLLFNLLWFIVAMRLFTFAFQIRNLPTTLSGYKKIFPDSVKGEKIYCSDCDVSNINMERQNLCTLHSCRQCGTALYRSSERWPLRWLDNMASPD